MCLLLLFETSVEKTCAEFRKSKLHTSIGTWSACTNPVKYCGQNYLLRTPVRFYFCLWGKHTIPPCNGRRKYYCIWISLCETIQLILCDRCQMCVWGWHGLSVAVRFTFVHFCPLVFGYVHLFSISAKLCPFMLIVVYLRLLVSICVICVQYRHSTLQCIGANVPLRISCRARLSKSD